MWRKTDEDEMSKVSSVRVAPVELFFDRNENAEVTGFTFVQRGERIKVPKLR
jgi:hypothetical protein